MIRNQTVLCTDRGRTLRAEGAQDKGGKELRVFSGTARRSVGPEGRAQGRVAQGPGGTSKTWHSFCELGNSEIRI